VEATALQAEATGWRHLAGGGDCWRKNRQPRSSIFL